MTTLRGLMQSYPLLISTLLTHASKLHPDREIVSRMVEGHTVRTNYGELEKRCKRIGNALQRFGLQSGDRVGTLAWNTVRHLELYFGVSNMGYVLHTVNPRLFPEQLEYIINHAEDRLLFVDLSFVSLVEKLAPKLATVRHYVIMTDAAHMPKTTLPNVLCYETLLGEASSELSWPTFDENTAAALCYTSGTTGNPKGVLYSHRSTVLHTMAAASTDNFGVSSTDSVLLIVPLFHANGWGMAYVAAMVGLKLVLPAQHLDGRAVCDLMSEERVTYSLGVPTVWLMFLQYLEAHPGRRPPVLRKVMVGGSAAPPSMIRSFLDMGVQVLHIWGMSELSPMGTSGHPTARVAARGPDAQFAKLCKQGHMLYGVEMKIQDDQGRDLPHDGRASGHLLVRGPWIASGYFKGEGGRVLDADGFFPTGDVATIDADGYMHITDRAKDIVKSGGAPRRLRVIAGEWISSIDLENAAVGHPAVREAAVIGVPHPKWSERPLLLVVLRDGCTLTKEDMLGFLKGRVASWWLPDDVVVVPSLPHTATGKLHKLPLREQYKNHLMRSTSAAASRSHGAPSSRL